MKLSIIPILVLLFSISCDSKSNQEDKRSLSDQQISPSVNQTISKEQTQQVLAAYLMIKNALVETNGELASTGAKTLLDALGDSQDELIKSLRMDAAHISGTQEASHQREHFNTLSDNVYALVKDGSSTEETIYRQFCPMAMNNQGGYWLSAEKEIMNPYFGDKMLKCGSVKEEIK